MSLQVVNLCGRILSPHFRTASYLVATRRTFVVWQWHQPKASTSGSALWDCHPQCSWCSAYSPPFLSSCGLHCGVASLARGTGALSSVDTYKNVVGQHLTYGERALKFVGWLGGFFSRSSVLARCGQVLYQSCVDNIEYEKFFAVCSLPNSFQSWFLVAHLHVWLCMVRLKREGKDGHSLIKHVVSTFWRDVEERMKVLGVHSSSIASQSLRELVQEFYGLTLAYEEGLLLDDKILAAAVWRNLIHDKANMEPEQLAKMVDYIRRQVKHMDGLDSEQILTTGKIALLPFV